MDGDRPGRPDESESPQPEGRSALEAEAERVPAHEAPPPADAAGCPLFALPPELRRKITSRLLDQTDAAAFGLTCSTAARELQYRGASLESTASEEADVQKLRSALKRAAGRLFLHAMKGGLWISRLARLLTPRATPGEGPAVEVCPELEEIYLRDEELFTGACRCDREGSARSFNQLRGLRGLPAGCRIVVAGWYCPPPDFFRPPAPGEPTVLAGTYTLSADCTREPRFQQEAEAAAKVLPPDADLHLVLQAGLQPPRVAKILSEFKSRSLTSLQIGPDWWEAACLCYRCERAACQWGGRGRS